jgi:hypothetical protein
MKNAIIGGVFFIGGILLVTGSGRLHAGGTVQEERQTGSVAGIDTLVISYRSAHVTLEPVEEETLVITERLRWAKPAAISAREGTLSIEGNAGRGGLFHPRRIEAVIGVPKSYLGNYRIKTSSGSFSTKGDLESAGTIEIRISSGSMRLERLRAPEIILRSSSGSLEADRLQGGIAIEMSSGSLSIGSIEGEHHRIRSSSGSIEIRALSGALVLRSSSGSTSLGISRLTGDLSFDISSGNLDLRLPRNAGFNLDTETSSGNVTIVSLDGTFEIKNRSSVLRSVGENPEHTVFARVRSGNIAILRE